MTISMGAFLKSNAAPHSIKVFKAVNIGTNESPIIGEWTMATILNSTETTATINSHQSTTHI